MTSNPLGPCALCVKPAMATVYDPDDGSVIHNLCIMHTVAFTAPLVLMTMKLHHQHLVETHSMDEDEAAKIVAMVAAAVADGNGELLLMPVCQLLPEDMQHQTNMSADDDIDDIIRRIQDGTIEPDDFG